MDLSDQPRKLLSGTMAFNCVGVSGGSSGSLRAAAVMALASCTLGMLFPFDSNHRSPSKGDRPIFFVSAASFGGAENPSNASPAVQSPTA
jgi:hypothetical protein